MFINRPLPLQDNHPVLTIGLVNNMPPAAFRATEAQFGGILRQAGAGLAPRLKVHLRCFAAHSPPGATYETIDELWGTRLDALIVTGAPPQAGSIADEPLMPLIEQLADWAAETTAAALWSCLAAHAVCHLDGVVRCRLPRKLSGLFACWPVSSDGLMQDAPPEWLVPHSRHNDVATEALEAAGYTILSRGPGGLSGADGANSFEKQVGASRFLMLQGHPEYGADSLLREYRRDVRLYLEGSAPSLPEVPTGYFDADTADALANLHIGLACNPHPSALAALDAAIRVPEPRWQPVVVQFFGRWLMQIAQSRVQGVSELRRAAS